MMSTSQIQQQTYAHIFCAETAYFLVLFQNKNKLIYKRTLFRVELPRKYVIDLILSMSSVIRNNNNNNSHAVFNSYCDIIQIYNYSVERKNPLRPIRAGVALHTHTRIILSLIFEDSIISITSGRYNATSQIQHLILLPDIVADHSNMLLELSTQ